MKTNEKLNLTMLCDFYELTMGNGYFKNGYKDRITYFDVFFRRVPDGGGFAIAAGLEQAIRYIQQLHFDEDDIAYLRGRKMFSEGFLESLRNYKFTGDIWAVPEGTPIFPNEPIMTVRAPAIEAYHGSSACRDRHSEHYEPSEPDCHEGQPRDPRGTGPHRS